MKIFLTIIFILFIQFIKGQNDLIINKNDFKLDSVKGLNKAWRKFQSGNTDYENGYYDYAIIDYKLAYKYNPYNPLLNYYLGNCYYFTDQKHKAIKYYKSVNISKLSKKYLFKNLKYFRFLKNPLYSCLLISYNNRIINLKLITLALDTLKSLLFISFNLFN